MADIMILVDGNSMMYRAFFAVQLMNNDAGVYTNALHVFLSMLLTVIEEEKPKYCAVAFDLHAPTFRHEQFEGYKAGRSPMPPELIPQMEKIKEILAAMHIPVMEKEGFEADDLLGTVSRLCEAREIDALILTGDRDTFQLVSDHVSILYTRKGVRDVERVTPEYIREKYGLAPIQMIDVKGLMGDPSDNIPGVPGVGEKTALKLIDKYGSLEATLENADANEKGALRERLMAFRDQAIQSKWLATIDRDVPLAFDFEDCEVRNLGDAAPILRELQLKQVEGKLNKLAASTSATTELLPEPEIAIEHLDSAQALAARMQGIRPAWAAAYIGEAASVMVPDESCLTVALGGDLLSPGASEEEIVQALAPVFDSAAAFILHDVKRWYRLGANPAGEIFDVMLAGYVLDSQRKNFTLPALCEAEGISLNEAAPAASLKRLAMRQRETLTKQDLAPLFFDIEMPLAKVLYDMEREGFQVDDGALMQLGENYAGRIAELESEIHKHAGAELNVNSPKQLGELLFERLGLKGGKKTKTGYSTSADLLEQMQDEHPVIPLILEYRKYAKLKSTYVDALLRLRGADGRIRTSFDQVATATGRISSQEPNLQNIPIRTALGRDIRRAFIARPGFTLVDADYSQIELRVLAHMSGDEVMREAFRLDQDIHLRTASEVGGVPMDEVTPDMRSAAKAVNFGIVYGISDFGLARNIGVTRQQAAQFIERYFERYPLIKKYMDECVETGKRQGYVTTLMGRRRYLPELAAGNDFNTRKFGERAAMNSPIQGTAADIIKMAMVRVHRELDEGGFRARLILQVHDELIIEAPTDEVEKVQALVKRAMEGVVTLDVPLKVDVSAGQSWYDTK